MASRWRVASILSAARSSELPLLTPPSVSLPLMYAIKVIDNLQILVYELKDFPIGSGK
jgi:hypothetical protein